MAYSYRYAQLNEVLPLNKNIRIYSNGNAMSVKIYLILFFLPFFDSFSQDDEYFLPFIDSSNAVQQVGYLNQKNIIVIPAKYSLKFYIDTLWIINNGRIPTPRVIAFKEKSSNYYLPYVLSQEPDNSEKKLKRIEVNGKMGFVDNKELIILPKYDYVGPFVNGFSEYYEGGSKVFFNGCWFLGGDSQLKGYLGRKGNEYSTREIKLTKTGELFLVTCSSPETHFNPGFQREIISFFKNGEFASRHMLEERKEIVTERRNLFGKKHHRRKTYYDVDFYRLNEDGDTTHIEKSVRGKLEGEYRLGQFDFYLDSVDTNLEHTWHYIRSFYSKDRLLNITNKDVFYINKNGRKVCKRTFIRQINRKKLKWTYTFLAFEAHPKIGTPINFFIYPDLNSPWNDSHDANRKLIEKGYAIKKRWWYKK